MESRGKANLEVVVGKNDTLYSQCAPIAFQVGTDAEEDGSDEDERDVEAVEEMVIVTRRLQGVIIKLNM